MPLLRHAILQAAAGDMRGLMIFIACSIINCRCQKIISHGINCFINRQLIYNFPEEIFADAGQSQDMRGDLHLSAVYCWIANA